VNQNMDFSGKHCLVLGLGESGLAMARWLHRCGAHLRVADTRSQNDRLPQLLNLCPEAQYVSGKFSAELVEGIDLVLVSPGLAPQGELVEISGACQAAAIPMWGELELFSLALADLKAQQEYQPKIIAITGTNGKTTVTSMVGLMCRRSGLNTCVAGNISPAMLDVLCERLEQNDLPQVWVLELSSFQLHSVVSFSADAATVLNVTQDHLDWHGDFKHYVADKARIFSEKTIQVLNRDDAIVKNLARAVTPTSAKTVYFGTDAPQDENDFGLLDENGMIWLAHAVAGEDDNPSGRKRKKGEPGPAPMTARLMPSDALKVRGQHNASNALAALALCRAIDLPLAPLLHSLREYAGEPHRVETVMTVAEVDYIDDSKGTNVGATVAALQGLGRELNTEHARILLIAGGDGKGQDFSPLQEPVRRYVKAVFLIGKDEPQLRTCLQDACEHIQSFTSLELAVQAAAQQAQAGEVVLLSPACASLDMFKNYAHRAQVFVDSVREIAIQRGEVC
jgi:UDP-N-acetylmuramoylalanine--D-glutamate ligase